MPLIMDDFAKICITNTIIFPSLSDPCDKDDDLRCGDQQCIKTSALCDGKSDCDDDESNCPTGLNDILYLSVTMNKVKFYTWQYGI